MIFGVAGACRREEITNVTINDVEIQGQLLLTRIPKTTTKISRSFTIDGEFSNIVQKYMNQRPKVTITDRFFLNWRNGKCMQQPIGINKFGSMPKKIAEYLQLPDAYLYTGYSFRRSSATLLADAGASITTIKRHGGWKSTAIAEGI